MLTSGQQPPTRMPQQQEHKNELQQMSSRMDQVDQHIADSLLLCMRGILRYSNLVEESVQQQSLTLSLAADLKRKSRLFITSSI